MKELFEKLCEINDIKRKDVVEKDYYLHLLLNEIAKKSIPSIESGIQRWHLSYKEIHWLCSFFRGFGFLLEKSKEMGRCNHLTNKKSML